MDRTIGKSQKRNNDGERLMKQLIVDYLPFEIQADQISESMKENKKQISEDSRDN